MTRPTTTAISSFFIVSDVDQTIVFDRSQMSAAGGDWLTPVQNAEQNQNDDTSFLNLIQENVVFKDA
jgi:hypothetical protein